MFEPLATLADLELYIGSTPPSNATVLINRASELVGMAMRSNYDPTNTGHVGAAKLATCAQVQDWIDRAVSAVATDSISSYSLGELSVTYANTDMIKNKLCVMAARYLNSQYLMYKGLR